jgi:hypothetical protein
MNSTKINVGIGRPSSGHLSNGISGSAVAGVAGSAIEVPGYVGFQTWRVRPVLGAESALSSPVMTDAPVIKTQLVSASERCP